VTVTVFIIEVLVINLVLVIVEELVDEHNLKRSVPTSKQDIFLVLQRVEILSYIHASRLGFVKVLPLRLELPLK